MLLELSTWCEVERYLETRRDIIIPIGSIEQHGPMGLISTDSICPEVIARGVAQRKNCLVAPTMKLGMSQHHLSFPGTITLRPTTMIAVLKDVISSLTKHGFTHLFFLNGHGGNVDSIKAAFSEIYTEHSLSQVPAVIHLGLRNWYEGDNVQELSEKYFKEGEGCHATPSELSLSFFAYPEAKKQAELNKDLSLKTTFRDCNDFRTNFPDGRMGADSSLATIDIGRELHRAAIEDVLEVYEEFISMK